MSDTNKSGRQPVTGRTRTVVIAIDKFVYRFSKHWLAIFNLAAFLYVGLPILAPVLMKAGLDQPAKAIYVVYSPMCHQQASRSFFLFGEQVAYPRELAGSDLTPIEAYTDSIPEFANSSNDLENWDTFLFAARTFLGNEQLGYKMALCERDIGIYGTVFLTGVAYAILRRRYNVKPLPLVAFIILGMGPIGLDGFTQLFGYYGLSANGPIGDLLLTIFPIRESPPLLRTFTGIWFGFALVWLAYPHINEGMKDSVQELGVKLRKAGAI